MYLSANASTNQQYRYQTVILQRAVSPIGTREGTAIFIKLGRLHLDVYECKFADMNKVIEWSSKKIFVGFKNS